MISGLAGIILMLIGLLGIINPQRVKKRIIRKMGFRLKLIVYGFILVFAVIILVSTIKAQGFLARIGGIIGLIVTIKVIMLVTSKSSEKLSAFLDAKPLIFFRSWAAIVFVMGMMFFWG